MPELIHYLVEGKVEAPIDWVSCLKLLGTCMYRVKWHIIVGPLLLPFTSYWSVFLLNSRYIIVNIISYMCMSKRFYCISFK